MCLAFMCLDTKFVVHRFLDDWLEKNDPNSPIFTEDDVNLNLLHVAVSMESDFREEVVRYLVSLPQVLVDCRSGTGMLCWTSAHMASSWGFDKTLDILLHAGADPFMTDINGHNVWDIASAYDNFECVYILETNIRRIGDTIVIEDDDVDDSLVSVKDEETNQMKHFDRKFKVGLVEDVTQKESFTHTTVTSTTLLDESITKLSDTVLRQRLLEKGESPGPIVMTTRDFYRRRLQRLQRLNSDVTATPEAPALQGSANADSTPKKSIFTDKDVKSPEAGKGDCILTYDENIIQEEDVTEKYFSLCETTTSKKLILLPCYCKEINDVMKSDYSVAEARSLEKEFLKYYGFPARKNFFNYILIDPRKRKNSRRESVLPSVVGSFDPQTFKDFISSCFYVGKGEGKRPLMHLYEAALQHRPQTNNKTTIPRSKKDNRKVERILEIWKNDAGVVSLQVFHCISSDEALARECLMIEALSLSNLTNIQIGQNKMRLLRMNERQRRVLGSYFLYKAYWMYVVHGDNQIRVSDVRF